MKNLKYKVGDKFDDDTKIPVEIVEIDEEHDFGNFYKLNKWFGNFKWVSEDDIDCNFVPYVSDCEKSSFIELGNCYFRTDDVLKLIGKEKRSGLFGVKVNWVLNLVTRDGDVHVIETFDSEQTLKQTMKDIISKVEN